MNMVRKGFWLIGLMLCCQSALGLEEVVITDSEDGNFIVPLGVSSITVEVWGAGGKGGDVSRGAFGGAVRAGGGGGGAYARRTFNVTPNQSIPYRVGAGGAGRTGGSSWFFAENQLLAEGGANVGQNSTSGAGGGRASESNGDVTISGGTGGNASGSSGGNGGNGASGGSGGNGGSNSNGTNGLVPGGGGGGAHCGTLSFCFARDGGNGANGQIRITYESPTNVCFTDDFTSASFFTENWETTVRSGGFTPSLVSSRLRMTQAASGQATAATLQRFIPAANNFVELEFDYFAYGGSGADGAAIVLSNALVTPQAGAFGGSLGYAQKGAATDCPNCPGFSGGWLGIALDEYGNFSTNTEGRLGGFASRQPQRISIRGAGNGTNGYRFIGSSAQLSPNIDATGSATPHRYRINIDSRTAGQSTLQIYRNTNNASAFTSVFGPINLLTEDGQGSVPDNFFLSLTGSTGGLTNVHEFGRVRLCAAELNPVGTVVDHFRLSFSSSALTCSAKEVTVVACANPNCTQQVTEPVSVTMSINGQAVGSPQVITGGSGTVQVRNTSEGTVSVGIAGSTPAQRPFSQNWCSRDGGALDTNCNITFADSGFALSAPDFPANRGETLEIRAIKKDDATQACVPGFSNTNKTLEFWGTYVNPGSSGRVANWPLSIQGNDIGVSEASASAQTVAFDANGVANVPINYADVGRMQVNARLQPSGDDAGLSMTGNTQFVSYPAGFCVQASAVCNAPYDTCPVLAKASENVPLSVQAMAWQVDGDTDFCSGNSPTPSFAMNTMALSSELIAPATGVNATVSPASLTYSASTSANTVPVSFSEVGVFAVRVTPSAPYLGITLDSAVSHAMGRITPDHFTASLANSPELAPYCQTSTAFAYSGQPLNWLVAPRVDLIARNGTGQVTQNYTQGNFLRLNSAGVGVQWPSQDEVAQGTDSSPLALNSTAGAAGLNALGNGQLRYDFSALDQLTYVKTPTSRVDPFAPDVTFGFTVNDSDGVGLLSSPFTFSPAANFALRYGRLWVDNGFGPENQDLPLSLRTEFYQSGRFIRNTDDSCWSYDAVGNVSLTPTTLTEVNGTTGTLINGDGVGAIVLRAPTAVPGLPDVGQVEVEYAVPVWLRDDFNNDGTLTSPRAQAQFGVYRGHDRIIYWRERQ